MTARLGVLLAATPRTLAHDLWTTARDPLPRVKRSGWHDWLPAIVVGLVLCAALLAAVSINTLIWQYGLSVWYACPLGAVQSVALVAALYRPVPAWWVVTAAMVVVALSSDFPLSHDALLPWTAAGLTAQAGVLFLMALRLRPRVAVEALAVSFLAGLASGPAGTGPHIADPRIPLAVLATAVVVGIALRGRQVARSELVVQEERTAEERGRRTLLEERNRIARELHDVVAHHMSVISIQAQVAPHLVENPSAELKENLAGIRQNAVEALTELRRVLGVLRFEDILSQEARHAPQPTLDRLPDLLANVRAAGLTVTTEVTGAQHPCRPAWTCPRSASCRNPSATPCGTHPEQRSASGSGTVRPRSPSASPTPRPPHPHRHHGPRPARHAGTGHHAGRRLHRRTDPGRRLRSHGAASPGEPRMTIRVVIADDQMMVRQGFTVLLNAEPGIDVVGQAVDGHDAVAKVAELAPDVVLMDIRMPGLGGIEATRRITEPAGSTVKVLILTTFDLDEYVYEALRAGASGFLLKDASAEELAQAVRVVAAGDALLAPNITKRVIAEFSRVTRTPRAPERGRAGVLTERETEVLSLIAQGMSNAETAGHLVVAEQTVKTHVGRMLVKLGLRDRTQAAVFAYETGLVRPTGY